MYEIVIIGPERLQDLQAHLSWRGTEGWFLVAVIPNRSYSEYVAFLQREVRPQPKPQTLLETMSKMGKLFDEAA